MPEKSCMHAVQCLVGGGCKAGVRLLKGLEDRERIELANKLRQRQVPFLPQVVALTSSDPDVIESICGEHSDESLVTAAAIALGMTSVAIVYSS